MSAMSPASSTDPLPLRPLGVDWTPEQYIGFPWFSAFLLAAKSPKEALYSLISPNEESGYHSLGLSLTRPFGGGGSSDIVYEGLSRPSFSIDRPVPTCDLVFGGGYRGLTDLSQLLPLSLLPGEYDVRVHYVGGTNRSHTTASAITRARFLAPPSELYAQLTTLRPLLSRTRSWLNVCAHLVRAKAGINGEPSYNELSFEDAADAERVMLRAQRDFDVLVRHDRNALIQANDSTRVENNRTVEVGGKAYTLAHGGREVRIGADDVLEVRGTHDIRVVTDARTSIGRDSLVQVQRDEIREVGGRSTVLTHQDASVDVRGSATLQVGRHDAKRSLAARVEGTANVVSSETLELSSEKEVLLRCGTSAIRLTPEGVEIFADSVTVRGEDARLLMAEGVTKLKTKNKFQVVSDDQFMMVSSGASIGMASEVQVGGTRILLNSPGTAKDDIKSEEEKPTTIELVDQDGNPIPNQRYRLVLDDGRELSGFLDKNGKAQVLAPANGRLVFPDLADAEEA